MKHNLLMASPSSKSSTPHLTPQKTPLFLVKTAPKTSISIDWFQTHNSQTPQLAPGKHGRFDIKHLGRVAEFKNHYEIFLHGERVATLAAHPDKGILQPDCSFLKIDNKFLNKDLKALVEEINSTLCLKFRNVSRVDIACDFATFKNNLHPETFIERFIPQRKPRYVKLRRSVWSMVGKHERSQRMDGEILHNRITEGHPISPKTHRVENRYSYLRFGNPRSNVCYYLYNKSQEMRDKKNKPWIREKWEADNLNQSQDIWRLEFRIHSCSKGLIDEDAGAELKKYRKAKLFLKDIAGRIKRGMKPQTIQNQFAEQIAEAQEQITFWEDNKLDATADAKYFGTLDVLDNFHEFYAALFYHYFDFRHNDGQEKKRRMKKLSLLDIQKPDKSLMDLAEKMESNRTDRMLLKKLVTLNDELRAKAERTETPPAVVLDALKIVAGHYANTRELNDYIKKKFPDFSFEPEAPQHLNALFAEQPNTIVIDGEVFEKPPF